MGRDAWRGVSGYRANILRFVLYAVQAAAGVYAALFFAWRIREAPLLTFGPVVVAVLLTAAAEPLEGALRSSALGRLR